MTSASLLTRANLVLVACCTLLVACNSGSSTQGGASASSSAAAPSRPAVAFEGKPHFVKVPGDGSAVASFVQKEVQRGLAEKQRVLVYVGATWCEPCLRFHRAVESGELDTELAGVRFLDFDLDRDGPELEQAGYRSGMIPLLALPNADGTSSDLRISGSIKGPDAVQQNLLPRLRVLLEKAGTTGQ